MTVITNKKQQEWLHSTLPYRDLWIGLHDTHEDGHWLWVDGTYPNYTNWASSHPLNSSDRNCALMSHLGGHWMDQRCHSEYHYACSSTSNYPICHDGGIFFRDRCYWQVEEKKSSMQLAQSACAQIEEGAQVVIIRDGELNAFLSKLVYPVMWIGLTDAQHEGHFFWVDGSETTYRNWLPGEPNNDRRREDCATMDYGTGGWNDVPCRGYSYRVVCAVPPCSDDGEGSGGSGLCLDDSPHCSCVSSGYCLDGGRCHCLKRFHGMVCDKADVKVSLRTASHVQEGESIELKCHVNIPKHDYSLQIEHVTAHSPGSPLPEHRTNFFLDNEENGYYRVVIYNTTSNDTGNYVCVVSTSAGVVPVTRIDSAYVKVRSNNSPHHIPKPTPDKVKGDAELTTDGNAESGLTVAVAVLAACCILLIIALVVVKVLEVRREKNYGSGVRMSALLS
ncbi:macrophage mannose receptor 1-like isoform X2 [Patiria miniata]|nr:macrophage mannose receptor 1-like isoform X2 [Patiria miniata]